MPPRRVACAQLPLPVHSRRARPDTWERPGPRAAPRPSPRARPLRAPSPVLPAVPPPLPGRPERAPDPLMPPEASGSPDTGDGPRPGPAVPRPHAPCSAGARCCRSANQSPAGRRRSPPTSHAPASTHPAPGAAGPAGRGQRRASSRYLASQNAPGSARPAAALAQDRAAT